MAAACCSQDRYNSGNLEVPCAVCTFLWSAGTIPKFEQDTDVRKLLNLYIYIFKELVQISREIIFEIINNVGLISEIYQSIPSSRNPHRSKFFYFWVTFFQFKPHFESHFSSLEP